MTAQNTALLTVLALIAFAGNSVLARLALADGLAGPGGFTLIRIASGAVVLSIIAPGPGGGSWRGALALLGYAGLFSAAYLSLSTGTGALILFASVQVGMIGWGLRMGERLAAPQWLGVVLALGGLVWLVAPGLSQPDPLGAALMVGSGLCWAAYSLLGRGSGDATLVTAGNFMRAAALALPLYLAWSALSGEARPGVAGAGLAVISGALTSGLGYVVWYKALRGLSAARAGVVQLAVPPLASLGGVALGEMLDARLVVASAMILAGIALTMKSYANSK